MGRTVLKGTLNITCLECNKDFVAFKSGSKKYCSKKCYFKSKNGLIKQNCKHCLKEFDSYKSDKRLFCSKECFYNGRNLTKLKRPRPQYVVEAVIKANTGRRATKEQREKHSLFMRNRNKILGENPKFLPNFNPEACKLIEEYGIQNGYNFQHALNGGEFYIKELGYFVDGYDKENNIVIEYYEKYHNGPKRREKDTIRENKIIEYLNCKFIKLWQVYPTASVAQMNMLN